MPVKSIETEIPGLKNNLDIEVANEEETVFIECTSIRGSEDPNMENIDLHGQDYFTNLFSQFKYTIYLNVIPNFQDKTDIDRFFETFKEAISKHHPEMEEVKLPELKGYQLRNFMRGDIAVRTLPTKGGFVCFSKDENYSGFVDMNTNTLRNSLQRKIKPD